jgi:ATP synthase protein I
MTEPGRGPSPGELGGLGLQFVVAILLFLYIGQWLDRKLGTEPWLLIIGVFLGAGLSFYSMYRKLMAVQAADDAERKAKRERGG